MSLTDTLGSLAVASQGQYMTGVSTDISTSFVKPAGKPGDDLKMTATLTAMGTSRFHVPRPSPRWERTQRHAVIFFFVLFAGKSLAYTRIDFTNPAGQLVAYGSESSLASSVTSLTEVWNQRTRSTSASQLGMRCETCPRCLMHLLTLPSLGECQILYRW
jgi:acyl-coenzyme A thioesterase 13